MFSRNKEITQGSIISHIKNPTGESRFGVIITARCDISQTKVPSFTFLPIYNLLEWKKIYGEYLMRKRCHKEIISELNNILDQHKIPKDVFNDFSIESIIEKAIAPKKYNGIPLNSALRDFYDFRENNKTIFSLGFKCIKQKEDLLLNDLVRNNVEGAYYLGKITNDDSCFVIDLRSPFSIPTQIVTSALKKIDPIRFKRKYNDLAPFFIEPIENELIEQITTIQSPFVEHLLQKFTLTFSRIGLPDTTDDQFEQLTRNWNVI